MKRIIFCLTYLMFFAVTAGLMAQEKTKEEKKVVIVKKIVDDKGNVTETRTEASGEEADKLMKEMGDQEGVNIEIEEIKKGNGKIEKRIEKKMSSMHSSESKSGMQKTMEVNEEEVNGKMVKSYVLTRENDGKKEVIRWDGTGDMPEEIKEEMDRMKSMEMEGDDVEGSHKVIIMKEGGDGRERIIRMDKESESNHTSKTETHRKYKKTKIENPNKVSLGVMIDTDQSGVVVSEIVEDSAAEEAKLKAGDRITEIDNTPVSNIDELLAALSEYEPGDKIKIRYFRNNKAESTSAKLKARK